MHHFSQFEAIIYEKSYLMTRHYKFRIHHLKKNLSAIKKKKGATIDMYTCIRIS